VSQGVDVRASPNFSRAYTRFFVNALRKTSPFFVRKAKSEARRRIEDMERETGIEPATSSLGSWRSTAELLPLFNN
jgi:hypothetical protein